MTQRKPSLCIDARMAHSSGIGTCIRELAPYFQQSHFQVIVLVSQLHEQWCREIEQILFPYPIYSIQEQFAFFRKMPRCDIFWSPHYNAPIFPIRAKKRVVTIHDACHLALSHLLSPLEKIYAKQMMRWVVQHCDTVITSSHFSKGELTRYLGSPKNAVQVISNGIDPNRFQRIEDEQIQKKIQEKYQLPAHFFLFVGNHKAHKNITGLIQSFHRLSLPDFFLVMVGKSQGLRNSVSVFGNKICELGEVSDSELPVLYSLAEALILPSFYEGFGFPPLEAMSCGCPTIVSNTASLPEVCGEASLYVDPHCPTELTQSMTRLVQDKELKQSLIDKGRKRSLLFDWQKTADAYLRIFDEVLKDE